EIPVRLAGVEQEAGYQRVGAQRESADRRRLFFLYQLEEQLGDEAQAVGMEARLAHVDVVGRRGPRAEHEFAQSHPTVEMHLPELVACGAFHVPSSRRGGYERFRACPARAARVKKTG